MKLLGMLAAVEKEARLESLLVAMCSFGEPRLHRMKRGWYCCTEMHVAAAGASFEVKSDFDCDNPMAAALQCCERIRATLREWE